MQAADSDTQSKKEQILSLLAQAHGQRETRIFQASNGIPVALWWVLISFTALLTVFVSFSSIPYRSTVILLGICFSAGVVSILVVARLFDYPFEGGLALKPTDFAEVLGKIAGLINRLNASKSG